MCTPEPKAGPMCHPKAPLTPTAHTLLPCKGLQKAAKDELNSVLCSTELPPHCHLQNSTSRALPATTRPLGLQIPAGKGDVINALQQHTGTQQPGAGTGCTPTGVGLGETRPIGIHARKGGFVPLLPTSPLLC